MNIADLVLGVLYNANHFLRKPHLKIEEGKARWDRALKYGIEHWNRRASNDD